MDIIPTSHLKILKKMPCECRMDAERLCLEVRKIIAKSLRVTGRMISSCGMCGDVNIFKPSDKGAFVESPDNPGSCLFGAKYPACFQKAEPEYIHYLELKGVPIKKAMKALGIRSLFDLPADEI